MFIGHEKKEEGKERKIGHTYRGMLENHETFIKMIWLYLSCCKANELTDKVSHTIYSYKRDIFNIS